jgi:hypothetical protein
MSQYRFLQDAYVGQYFLAGTTAATADVAGGTLPIGWTPSVCVDPLDTAAVNAYWAAGPQLLGLVRQQWSTIPVTPPVTYWRAVGGGQYQLGGLGAGLPPLSMSNRGALP